RLEQWLAGQGASLDDVRESWFYSDSQNDLPLLERVTHPVAVDPDPILESIAHQRRWPVISLRH
ncbi:MAG: HAD-IB family hydrolase, partial [Betaproteobacteria bacterium]|nr:HAD-IB family hydrolase [Betaproteobacteria bacterium]